MHRDIALDNILIREDHLDYVSVVLIDFDTVCSHSKYDTTENHTRNVGKKSYMAYEVSTGWYGPQVDIWSLGVVLYRILTREYTDTGFAKLSPETIKNILLDKAVSTNDRNLIS
jgi:serine/threonine protein kinase